MEDHEEYSDEDDVQPFTFPQVKPLYWSFRKVNNSPVRKLRPLKRIPLQNITENSSGEFDSVFANSLSGDPMSHPDVESRKNTRKDQKEAAIFEKLTISKTPFSAKSSMKLIRRVPKDCFVYPEKSNESEVPHIQESKHVNQFDDLFKNEKNSRSQKGLCDNLDKTGTKGGRIMKDISNYDQNINPRNNSDLKSAQDPKHSLYVNGKSKVPITFRGGTNPQNVPAKTPIVGTKMTPAVENGRNGTSCVSRLQYESECGTYKQESEQDCFNSENNEKHKVERDDHPALPISHKTEYSTLFVNGVQYSILSKLGQGGSSQVYQVLDRRTSSLLAVKCVTLRCADETTAMGYLKEIEVLSKLQSSNRVIKLIDHEYLKPQQVLYVVMEKGDTDLSILLKQMVKSGDVSIPMIIYYWTEILHAVKEIHSHGIVHADLKPANFLLVCGRLKLIDFGIASSIQNDATSVFKNSMNGTCNYMSPEAIQDPGDSSRMKVGYKSDVWSLGCILYNFLYKKTPFQHITNSLSKLHMIANRAHKIDFPPVKNCPPPLMDALKRCLTYDARRRPTVADLLSVNYIWPTN